MRKILLLIFSFIIFGCDSDINEIAEDSLVQSSYSAEYENCIVNDEWLKKEYDHDLDYKNSDVKTDFFLLVYSNSPSFCNYMKGKDRLKDVPFQCLSPNKFGWVIHGLWGESRTAYIQGEKDKHPRFCKGDLPQLNLNTIKPYLCMSPGTSLLQGEWEKHGACDFDTANEYFDKTLELYERFLFPPAELRVKMAMKWMKENNPELENKRLHLTSHEFGICLTTEFEVMSCPNNTN